MAAFSKLPDAELEVMQTLWEVGEYPAHSDDLMARLEKNWKAPTLLKLLSRLEERGFVSCLKEGRSNGYTPLVRQADYLAEESRSFVSRLHGGSVSALVATLWQSHALSDQDISELRDLLEKGGSDMTAFLTGLAELTLAVSVLIALLLLVAPALARRFSPRWRYWAWLVLALRLAVPFNVSLPNPLVSLPVPALTAPHQVNTPNPPTETTPDSPPQAITPLPDGTGPDSVETPVLPLTQPSVGQTTQHRSIQISWPAAVTALWALGALTALSWQLFQHHAFLRMCRRWRRPASESDRAALERLAMQMKQPCPPKLYRCAAVTTPMLTGLVHPTILLPLELHGEALSVALTHELTHWARGDLWYKALLVWVRAVHWFNPLVWLLCRRAESDVEQCCDYDLLREKTPEDRRVYGQILLDQMTTGRDMGTRLTTGFSGGRREVLARFKALLDTSAKKKGRMALALVTALALLGGGLVACQDTAPLYDSATGLYRDEARAFELTIPQTVYDQLEIVTVEDGDDWIVSFVSTEVKETLGEAFDPAEDYWILVKLFHPEIGGTSRTVRYGEWNDLWIRCREAGMAHDRRSEMTDLYEAARDAYRSFVFLSTPTGGVSTETTQAGDWYNEEAEVYLNYDLDFGLNIPKEIYDQLIITTDLRYNSGPHVAFLDRRLVEDLGWDPDTTLANRDAFLAVGGTYLSCYTAQDADRLREHLERDGADPALVDAIMETHRQAGIVASTLFRLSTVDNGLGAGDAYDPESGWYINGSSAGTITGTIPGWVMDKIHTRRVGDTVTFSTNSGDPLLYWDGEAFTYPMLDTNELTDPSLDGVISYLELQDGLLRSNLTYKETEAGSTISLGVATVDESNFAACPDGTYLIPVGSASLSDNEGWMLFQPVGQTGAYYLPFAEGAKLTPLGGPPKDGAVTPGRVIQTGMLSSAYPHLEVIVKDNEITAFACVLGDEPLVEQQPYQPPKLADKVTVSCPDGTYAVSLEDASLSDDESQLTFTPWPQEFSAQEPTGTYRIYFAEDAKLISLYEIKQETAPSRVISSGALSSVYPCLQVTVKDNVITEFAAVPTVPETSTEGQ